MGGFLFDEQFSPLIAVTAPSTVDAKDLDELFGRFEKAFARRSRYALLLDLGPVAQIPPAHIRKKIGEWEAAHAAETRAWNVGAALVVRSSLVRGALTALSWLADASTERVHVATRSEGIEWCCARLERESITISPALAKLRLGRHELAS